MQVSPTGLPTNLTLATISQVSPQPRLQAASTSTDDASAPAEATAPRVADSNQEQTMAHIGRVQVAFMESIKTGNSITEQGILDPIV